MTEASAQHVPVLLEAALALLAPKPGEVAVDCTAGLGGHAAALAERLGSRGAIVLIDLDPGALDQAKQRIAGALGNGAPQVVSHRGNFAETARLVETDGLRADVALADLGFSSAQMDDSSRGFSMKRDGPLDMRLDPAGPVSAADLVNSLSEAELATILRDFGEEPAARAIARKLVVARRRSPIRTTAELASIVRSAVRRRRTETRIDPATRAFQALRIAVNDELGSLEALLQSVEQAAARLASGEPTWLAQGARVGVIAFHSLEDRAVKQAFRRLKAAGLAQLRTRKPATPGAEETARNPRARSAKLRVVELAGAEGSRPLPEGDRESA